MDTAIEVWESEGGPPVVYEAAESTNHRRTLWLGAICAFTVGAVLAFCGKPLVRPREEQSKAA